MYYRQTKQVARRMLLPMFMLCLSLSGLVACTHSTTTTTASSPSTPVAPTATSQPVIQAITIKAIDFSYELPQMVPAGLVDITLVNRGVQLHQAQFVHLNDGVTYEQFQSTLKQKGLLAMRQLGILVGGPNITPPGKSTGVILNLAAGTYVVLCPIPAKDGVRQYLKGMISTFTVTGSSANALGQTLHTDGTVMLKSFSFDIPATILSGSLTWKVMNIGQEPYEMNVVKLAPGKTAKDVITFYTHPVGPPPFLNLGGMSSISPGVSGWVKLQMVAGNYVVFSQVLDKATGKPQFLLGMISTFTVQ